MKFPKRIHIIPVGNDNLERLAEPVLQTKADRVYLITRKVNDQYQSLFDETKAKILLESNSTIEIITILLDIFNYAEILEKYASIIHKEQNHGNHIYISLSTGGNLMASAGMLACTLFRCEPYFYLKDIISNNNLKQSSYVSIPHYYITPPAENLIRFLKKIQDYLTEMQIQEITKKECLKIMSILHSDEPLSHTSGDFNKLKFRYLNKLETAGYIQIEKKQRGKIKLSIEGIFGLQIFSKYYDI